MQAALGPLTDWMLAHLAAQPGQTVLELGAGTAETGLAAARLVSPGGRVIVSDRSSAMVAAAVRRAAELGLSNVEMRVIDIEAIDLPDAAVDGVLCRLALMLVPDPAVALAEIHRVVRPGGRLAATVWDTVDRNPWAPALWEVLERMTNLPPARPGGPGMFSLAEAGRLQRAPCRRRVRRHPRRGDPGRLEVSGLRDVLADAVGAERRAHPAPADARRTTSATGWRQPLRDAVERFRTEDGYAAPGSALGVVATRVTE